MIFFVPNLLYRSISKSMQNDTFPSVSTVSKMSYSQSDRNRNGKSQVTSKTDWTSK